MVATTTEHFNFFNVEATSGYKLLDSFLKIRLKRINIQERIIMETLNSSIMELVMSLEFARKQEFKLKKKKDQYIDVIVY